MWMKRRPTPDATIRTELKRTGTPIPSNDVWIAALCRQHSFSLLSRDRHFDLVRGIEADRLGTLRNRPNALVHPAERLVGVLHFQAV